MKIQTSRKLIKATFEAVLNAQEQLRVKFDELIRENRPIKDERERAEFMRLLAHSTLGLGANHKVVIDWSDTGSYNVGGVTHIDNIEKIIRIATYYEKNVIEPHTFLNQEKEVSIGFIWEKMKIHCFGIFPLALDKSLSMSKERDEQPQTGGYAIE